MSTLSNAFLISHGANAVFALLLIIVSIRLYRYSRISIVLYITMLMSSWAVTNFLLILPILFNVSDTGINLIATWNIIGSVLVPSLFILFIDSFEGQVEATKVGVATATIGAAIFIAISGLSNDIAISSTIVVVGDLTTMRWSPITSLAIFPTVLLAGYWTQKELIKSSKHAFDPRQILQIKIMRIGGCLHVFHRTIIWDNWGCFS